MFQLFSYHISRCPQRSEADSASHPPRAGLLRPDKNGPGKNGPGKKVQAFI